MKFRRIIAALVAALVTCALSVGLPAVASAGAGGVQGASGTTTTTTGNGSGSTATSGPGNSSQGCDGSHNSNTGHGANHSGPYDNTCDGSPSGNGNGNGQATGKPCAGCVGNADDKNPKGQYPNGTDHNAGYECDRNHGIGRTNPAHTGCNTSTPSTCTTPGGCSPGNDCTTPGGCSPGNDCTTPGGCSPGNDCTTPGGCAPGQDCTTPGGCSPGQDCTTPGGCAPGGSTPGTPGGTGPGVTPQQVVLGTRATGGTLPAGAKRRVLGASSNGSTSPSQSAAAPASTTHTEALTAAKHGTLPFTGTDVLLVLAAGSLLLVTGLGLQRLLAHRA